MDFLLAELRLSASGGAESTSKLLGADGTKVLLNTLVAFESPEYQNRARDGIDGLFKERLLAEADYVAAVTRLNGALGNESPVYLAFRAEQVQQQQARREAAEEDGRRELRDEFAAEFARQSCTEVLPQTLRHWRLAVVEAVVLGSGSSIVGEAALPQLHEALAAASHK